MADVKMVAAVVVLGLCLLVGHSVHGYDETDTSGWQFSADDWASGSNYNPIPKPAKGGDPNANSFAAHTFDPYKFGSHVETVPEFADVQDTSYVYDATKTDPSNDFFGAQGNDPPTNPDSLFSSDISGFDMTEPGDDDARFSSQYSYDTGSSSSGSTTDPASLSVDLDSPQNPDYVYNAREEGGDPASLAAVDPQSSNPAFDYVYDAHNQAGEQDATSLASADVHEPKTGTGKGSAQFYSPSSDPNGPFRFYIPDSAVADNIFAADASVYNYNSPVTSATADPVLAAYNARGGSAPVGGSGCPNLFWAQHPRLWPSFLKVDTKVSKVFGNKVRIIFGTTTILQALYDTRVDGFSKLLSHGTAAVLNSYMKKGFPLRHDAVVAQFNAALSSRAAAAAQAQKFENLNRPSGANQCTA